MTPENNAISPTLTLAQLYDAQKLFNDAYIVYKQLYQANPTEDLHEKLKSAEGKMFSDPSLEYNDIIKSIFNEKEREQFRILPDKNFQNIKKSSTNQVFETIEFSNQELPEDEQETSEIEEIEIEYDIDTDEIIPPAELDALIKYSTSPPIQKAASSVPNTPPASSSLNQSNNSFLEFIQLAVSVVGENKKVSDITLGELSMILEKLTKK